MFKQIAHEHTKLSKFLSFYLLRESEAQSKRWRQGHTSSTYAQIVMYVALQFTVSGESSVKLNDSNPCCKFSTNIVTI